MASTQKQRADRSANNTKKKHATEWRKLCEHAGNGIEFYINTDPCITKVINAFSRSRGDCAGKAYCNQMEDAKSKRPISSSEGENDALQRAETDNAESETPKGRFVFETDDDDDDEPSTQSDAQSENDSSRKGDEPQGQDKEGEPSKKKYKKRRMSDLEVHLEETPTKQDQNCERVFHFLIGQIAKQKADAIQGKPVRIPMTSFVQAGIFSDIAHAYHFMVSKRSMFLHLGLEDTGTPSKKDFEKMEKEGTLKEYSLAGVNFFQEFSFERGMVLKIVLCVTNKAVLNWESILANYVPVPPYSFNRDLGRLGSLILFQACYLARQKKQRDQIKENHEFAMRVDKLLEHAGVNTNIKNLKKIKDRLEEALGKIRAMHAQYRDSYMSFSCNWDKDTSAREVIDSGTITVVVHPDGPLARNLEEITRKEQQREYRKQSRINKALKADAGKESNKTDKRETL